jgi:hypothetical protein
MKRIALTVINHLAYSAGYVYGFSRGTIHRHTKKS